MERYYSKKPKITASNECHEYDGSKQVEAISHPNTQSQAQESLLVNQTVQVQQREPFLLNQIVEFDVNDLEADPGLRPKISSFHPNVQ
ncbi:unnamed protein product, partial [Linum tenue]